MSGSDEAFGGGLDQRQMAELVAEFVPLDRQRRLSDAPLGAVELERWTELRDQLAHEFGHPLPVGPTRPPRHLRVPAQLKVHVGDDVEPATLENLSEGGIFVSCGRPLAPGTPLRISIESDLLEEPLEVDVLVVHSRSVANRDGPAGFGALLQDLEGDDYRAVTDLVEAALASAIAPP